MALTIVHQGGDQYLGAVVDAFNLELHERIGALAQCLGSAHALFLYQLLNLAAQRAVADADKTPRLHQADAGRLVRGVEQALQQFRRDAATAEVAHVAAFGDGAIDGLAIGLGESVVSHGLIGGKPPPTFGMHSPVGAGLPAIAVSRSGANNAATAPGFDGK